MPVMEQRGPLAFKQGRILRACDVCRRKKMKCVGETSPGRPCTTCLAFGEDCTWSDEAKKRGPRRKRAPSPGITPPTSASPLSGESQSDVAALRARVAFLENALQQTARTSSIFSGPIPPVWADSSMGGASDEGEGSEDVDQIETLAERTARLEVDASAQFAPVHPYRESSGAHFTGKVQQIKEGIQRRVHQLDFPFRSLDPWEREGNNSWRIWQAALRFDFPEPNLLASLVEAYMVHVNSWVHLFHRPTFEAGIQDRLHERDHSFACVLLMVCAHGSRHVDDTRVCLPGMCRRSAGWPYFRQVPIAQWDLTAPPRLYEVQMCCAAAFFIGGSIPRLAWRLLGIGIRMCQELGLQHRALFGSKPHPHHELWKRCFWMLFCMDLFWASESGRPFGWHEADFDVDFPLDCDDEYWSNADPSMAFRQPPGQRSRISQYIESLKLKLIHMRALRTLFSPASSSKDPTATLATIDSDINLWADTLPQHLRYDPHLPTIDELTFIQAALLQLECNQLRITIHRPHAAARKPTFASASSHAICTHAARANSHISAVMLKRMPPGRHFPPQGLLIAYSAATVLLLNLWGTQRTGMRVDPATTLADVENCLTVMRLWQPTSRLAMHFHDQLTHLASRGNLPFPHLPRVAVTKRARDTASSPPVASAPSPITSLGSALPIVVPPFSYPSHSASLQRALGRPPAPPAPLSTWVPAGSRPIQVLRDTSSTTDDSCGASWQATSEMTASLYTGKSISTLPAFAGDDVTTPTYILPSHIDAGQPPQAAVASGSVGQSSIDDCGFMWDDELLSLWTGGGMIMGFDRGDLQVDQPDYYPLFDSFHST